jgi:NADPH-dependent glutamate synthase beta subunit-like oxidoreductase
MTRTAAPVRKYRVKIPGYEDYDARVACRSACPLRTDVRGYTQAIAEGDYERGYLIARRANPLVSVCSRICQAPCEQACRRADVDAPVAIRGLKRFVCDRAGTGSPRSVLENLLERQEKGDGAFRTAANDILGLLHLRKVRESAGEGAGTHPERVAVVGSGPAGLAAAHDLALLGYKVTIFEAASEPGGMLRMVVPPFRLPREVLRREIEAILELGVDLELNSPVGEDRTLSGLRQTGYQAIFIAVGLPIARMLPLEGMDLSGVASGLTYLRDFEKIPAGESCVVIGGGGVALDCAQMALRQGVRKVSIACVESWEGMPATTHEKEDSLEEGVAFYPGLGPKRILGRDGRAIGVEFLEVESVFDEQGKFNPQLRPGTERILPADTVLLAVGQTSLLSVLSGIEGLQLNPSSTIRVGEDLATNIPGIFAGGDVASGPRSAVEAIADGQRAARSIHGFLRGSRQKLRRRGYMEPLGTAFANTRGEKRHAIRPPKRPVQERIRNHEEIELPYREVEARQQAERCQQCHVQTVFNRRLCILCGTCVDTCVKNAYRMVRLEQIEGDEKLEKLAHALCGGLPRTRPMTAIIKDEARCVRCGRCALRCPAGAITMEAFHVEEEWEDEGEPGAPAGVES